MAILAGLEQWYLSQCNGDWEHSFGIEISTLDNPGWRVVIDLRGTELENSPFSEISTLKHKTEWMRCWIEDQKFHGAGGPLHLSAILAVFTQWAKDSKPGEQGQ
jgi:hypothetical protein